MLLVRYLGGDLAIIDEVSAFRGFQEQLSVHSPNDPRRIFGAAVATSSSTSTKMANMFASEAGGVTNAAVACEQVLGRLLPSLFQKLSEALAAKLAVQIDERLAALADTSAPRGEKRKECPQPVASNVKMLRLQGEGHLPSAGDKYMKRLESANTTGTRADLAERHLGNGGRRLKVVALKGEDKVVQRVIHKCWGQELSSKSVHQKVRNLRYTIDSGKSARDIARIALDRIVNAGLAEVVQAQSGTRGHKVTVRRWYSREEMRKNGLSNDFLRSLGLGEEYFRPIEQGR